MRPRQYRAVEIPARHARRLQGDVRTQPARRQAARDHRRDAERRDERAALREQRLPVARQRRAGVAGAEERVEDRVLEEREAERRGRGAQRQDQAQVAGARLEGRHGEDFLCCGEGIGLTVDSVEKGKVVELGKRRSFGIKLGGKEAISLPCDKLVAVFSTVQRSGVECSRYHVTAVCAWGTLLVQG